MDVLEKAILEFESTIGIIGESGPARDYVEKLKIVLAAASRQIPCEPAEEKIGPIIYLNCPECGKYICRKDKAVDLAKHLSYCKDCGKKLLWLEEK